MDQTLVVGVMAKAKKKAAGKPERVRKPVVVQIRSGEAWRAWAEDVAAREGLALTMLVDRAMRAFARQNGYPDPPRR